MHPSLISVIIPVYNVERYLEQCIQSIVNQTYSNLEIILVDDGSVDRSGEICDKYANMDSRIIVIHKQNGGLSDARNTGLNRMTGEYVSFIDSDDYIAPNMYERMIGVLQEKNADYAICNFEAVNANGKEIEDISYPEQMEEGLVYGYELMERTKDIHNTWSYIIVCTKLYRSEMFQHVRFPKGKMNEDEFVFQDLMGKNLVGVTVAEKLYFYRRSDNTITTSAFGIKNLDLVEAYYNRYLFCREHKEIENIISMEEASYRILRKAYQNFSDQELKTERMHQAEKMYKEMFYYLKGQKCIDRKLIIKRGLYCHFTGLYTKLAFRNGRKS